MGDRAQITDLKAHGASRRWMPVLAAGLSRGEYARSLFRRLAAADRRPADRHLGDRQPGVLLAGVGLAGARGAPAARFHRELGVAT